MGQCKLWIAIERTTQQRQCASVAINGIETQQIARAVVGILRLQVRSASQEWRGERYALAAAGFEEPPL